MSDLKLLSELTKEDLEGWEWMAISKLDNPMCLRGIKKTVMPEPPLGMEWEEVTAMGDDEKKYILVFIEK